MSTFEFNELLLSNAQHLKPFALSLTRDNEEAKELLQETFYRALANKDKYNNGTNLKAWLFTIMRNIFINSYNSKARRNTTLTDTSSSMQLVNAVSTAVVNNAVTDINVKEIKKAIYALPEIFKNPFELYFNGYRYHEIADILKEPLGTIKSRIHFARKILQNQIERAA
ncbi:MAG: RNA polymerase subunit sigma [Chitinophaga sp.]|jgi:RNA polymerase sigma factor (sigma-70 family)|nr:RNA polymerase subunit sigma [Chitinophaga sp.]